jgi:putative SOS response-associated peptidase YedK
MCGRYQNHLPPEAIARIFGTRNPVPNYPPRYNIAPTDPVLAVRFNRKTGERSLDALRWGLVPVWAKDLKFGARAINARFETLEKAPAFRDAFAERRCLIPATGFYEWQESAGGKQPYAFVPEGEPIFALAGLWERWRDRNAADAPWVRSCTIVVGAPNELVAPIHDRMPIILPPSAWPLWLGEVTASPAELKSQLESPYPAERMRAYRVSTRVGNVKNDEPSLIEPVP